MSELSSRDVTHLLLAWHQGKKEAFDKLVPDVYEALRSLARVDQRKCQVVEFCFSGGMTAEETAEALVVSSDTVMRDWKLARAWLARELKKTDNGTGNRRPA